MRAELFDTYSQAAGAAATLTKVGQKSWYFVTVDYAFSQSLEKDAWDMVKSLGGTVVGSVRHPLNASDFSSFLLQAQSSKAQVIGLANGGQDMVNAIKAARSFDIGTKNQRLAGLLVFLSDVHALGLNDAQGLIYTDGFYWDFDSDTRAFSKRFEALNKGNKLTMVHAGVYSSVYYYYPKAAAATKSHDWKVATQKIRETPIHDAVMRNASIRPDGRG